MSSLRLIFLLSFCLGLTTCTDSKKRNDMDDPGRITLSLPPQEIDQAIQQDFPGAMPTLNFADSMFGYVMKRYNITSDKILLGASTCVDDIIYTKNFHHHPEIRGPFHLGGLAGLPFSGISGLNAFSHHVPEDGAMLLLIGTHIGYSTEKGWGYVGRPGQEESSSCCGALMGTLSNLQKEDFTVGVIDEDDYEGGKLNQFALAHKEDIMKSTNPLITLTKLTGEEAEAQVRRFLPKVHMDYNYVISVTGVLINTKYTYSDYFWMTHFTVYDVQKKIFIEDRKY